MASSPFFKIHIREYIFRKASFLFFNKPSDLCSGDSYLHEPLFIQPILQNKNLHFHCFTVLSITKDRYPARRAYCDIVNDFFPELILKSSTFYQKKYCRCACIFRIAGFSLKVKMFIRPMYLYGLVILRYYGARG